MPQKKIRGGKVASRGSHKKAPKPLLIGRRALREVLRHAPGRIERVCVAEGKGDRSGSFQEIMDEVKRLGIDYVRLSAEELDAMAGGASHQGFVAELGERPGLDLKGFLEKRGRSDRSVVVMLDSVFDPQNLGAILRAAECFGADAVLWSWNRGCGWVSPAAVKASAGASELVTWVRISNLVESLKKLKSAGYWAVAADATYGAQDLRDFTFPEKTVLVVGSEGAGLSPLLLKECDFKVKIPMFGKIESLNVSQATAIFLFAYGQTGVLKVA
ncbi:MAG: 23S rRNA (guanosine(2251)-2'-O)-methyltransferase RlmB [Deltaproteobacteria bacterium]|nr:23S rRNA (guanosine(2251)-2'-O)-methyltransferase RlmB [Deltaproteobacteria bacterium]